MKYLHTMIRVGNLEKSVRFYVEGMGFKVMSRQDYPEERFSLVFLKANGDLTDNDQTENTPAIELTHNWDQDGYVKGDGYGHMAFSVPSINALEQKLKASGFALSWGPGLTPNGKTRMAFVDDPDGYEIELLEYRV